MASKPKTLLEFLDMMPPCLVRAMAMKAGRLKTNEEVVVDSGLSTRTMQRIIKSKSWAEIRVGTISKFLKGCSVDIVNREGIERFITDYADGGFPHMDVKQKKLLYKRMEWPGI